MTRAAEQLHVAQPALGTQMRHLEDDLGVKLLVRHSRGVTLTNAGERLYEGACKIMQLVEETRRDIGAPADVSAETVALGLTPSLVHLLGPDLLVAARDEIPEIALSLVEELSFALVEALELGKLDLALCYEVGERRGLVRRPLLEESLVLVTAAGKGAVNGTVTLEEALSYELALPGERDVIRQIVDAAARAGGHTVKLAFEAYAPAALKRIVGCGAAASVLPFGFVADDLARGTLVGRAITDPAITRTLYLVRPVQQGPSRNHDALVNFLGRNVVKRLADTLGPLAHQLPRESTARPTGVPLAVLGAGPASSSWNRGISTKCSRRKRAW
jgi:LysR family nitrogen assimilation transcriptional regulator